MIDRFTTALSRRKMLMGLALSATAATVADAATSSEENPDMITMADGLPVILAEYVAARDNVKAIVAEWSPQWPVPPESIVSHSSGCRVYRDIEGHGLEMPLGKGGLTSVPHIGTPQVFEASAAHHEKEAARCAGVQKPGRMQRHLLFAERDRASIEPARAYWSEVDRITTASGIEAAQARKKAAEAELKTAVDQIMGADDWTLSGTVIKAQAIRAWAEVECFPRMLNERAAVWADALAASIMKHAGESA